jgi:hypothetical protein
MKFFLFRRRFAKGDPASEAAQPCPRRARPSGGEPPPVRPPQATIPQTTPAARWSSPPATAAAPGSTRDRRAPPGRGVGASDALKKDMRMRLCPNSRACPSRKALRTACDALIPAMYLVFVQAIRWMRLRRRCVVFVTQSVSTMVSLPSLLWCTGASPRASPARATEVARGAWASRRATC